MHGGEAAPRSVLFVCTHNIIRSPMAAALMRLRFGPLVRVDSAGIRPGEEIDAMAAFVMDEAGEDISRQRPKGLSAFAENEDGPFDLIVSLSPEAHHSALESGSGTRAVGGVLAHLRPIPRGRLARTAAYGVSLGPRRA